jgi:hypothetical protein
MGMETLVLVATVAQGVAISLGVGTSTMAIVNFFAAIADGKIDEAERRMMGLVYFVLRVAMVIIMLTMLALFTAEFMTTGTVSLTTFTLSTILLVCTLYGNAILMTMRIMPSTVGPALQASTWYTLGIMASLNSLGLVTFGVLQFILGYASAVVLAVAIVNGIMAIMKHRQDHPPATKPPTTKT